MASFGGGFGGAGNILFGLATATSAGARLGGGGDLGGCCAATHFHGGALTPGPHFPTVRCKAGDVAVAGLDVASAEKGLTLAGG